MGFETNNFSIIRTKFSSPRLTDDLVVRDRLLNLLDRSLEVPLTLVCAPAGYGKSVLISQWLDRQDHDTFWLSLDETESALRQFLSYLIEDLREKVPEACKASWELLRATEKLPVSAVAACLANDLEALDQECSIVLDDYHLLNHSSGVHTLLEHFLRHPPSRVHLILISRRDPALSLNRLRAANQLLEIRMQDLCFNPTECRELLANSTGCTLSEDALTNLQEEIEGWAVGLRLTSLAVKRSEDPEAFVKSLHGGIPYVQEYLLQEVLSGLNPDVRDYLLKSSLLNRFCADLIEHVCVLEKADSSTSGLSGADFVRTLQLENIFAISLDERNRWFRYHHLFQNLLQRELSRIESQDQIAQLHLRASHWFENRGLVEEAFRHALKAGDELFAARIAERHCYSELEADRWYVLESWLKRIPQTVVQKSPILLLSQAWVAAFRQQLAQIAELMDRIPSLLHDRSDQGSVWGEVDFFRGYLAFWDGAFEKAAKLLTKAQSRIAEHKTMLIAETDLHLAIVLYMKGEGDRAIQMMEGQINRFGGLQLSRRIGALAFIRALAGDLPGLKLEARQMRSMDKAMRSPLTDAWSHYFSGWVALHQFQLTLAIQHFSRIVAQPYVIDRRGAVDVFAGLALAQQLSGQLASADATIDNLLQFVTISNDPENLAIAQSLRTRVLLLRDGSAALSEVQRSVAEAGVFDLFLWLEVPAMTRIRLMLAAGSDDSLANAQVLIDELRSLSESSHLKAQLVEIEILQALVFEQQGRSEAALGSLTKAIGGAEPGGWIRPFIEAGPQMSGLLEHFRDTGDVSEFVNRLITERLAFETAGQSPAPDDTGQRAATAPMQGSMHDGLTNRELDILELLAQRLQNKEIANQLFISTHTVKDHLKHIYQKLGVSNRRSAVARAVEAELISPP